MGTFKTIDDIAKTESIQDEIEPMGTQGPILDVIEQMEAEDLSSLEAELYSELIESMEAEYQEEAE